MDRRTFIATGAATSALAIAGCTSDEGGNGNGNGNGDSEPEQPEEQSETTSDGDSDAESESESNTDSDTDTAEDDDSDTDAESDEGTASPSTSLDMPDSVSAGEEFTLEYGVTNDGDAEGEIQYGLDLSFASADSWESVFEDAVTLGPGESESESTDSMSFDQTRTIQLRMWAGTESTTDTTTRAIEVSTPSLEWGDGFEVANGLAIAAGEPHLTDSYDYESWSGDAETHEAPEGQQFCLINVRVENRADETRQSPNILGFEAIADGERVETMGYSEFERSDDMYDGLNDLPSDSHEEGLLPYQIDDDLDADDIRLFHSSTDFDTGDSWEIEWD